jgi:hypothetical protein
MQMVMILCSSARHRFTNPGGYPGMGRAGTGTGDPKGTRRKPTLLLKSYFFPHRIFICRDVTNTLTFGQCPVVGQTYFYSSPGWI